MKLSINGKTIEINEIQLAEINNAIADAPVVNEKYDDVLKEYVDEITAKCLQIRAITTLSNSVYIPNA